MQRVLPLLIVLLAGLCSQAAEIRSSVRVMTYNIHHAEGLDKKLDVERIAGIINGQRPDIVALQEVDKGVERTAKRDLPAELSKLTGMSCVFSNNYHYQGGEYGNAVLTRLPIKSSTNQHFKMLREGEQRGILQLVLDAHGEELVFMNTHIDFRQDDTERLANVKEIEAIMKDLRGRTVVLCGDFNDTPGSRTYQGLSAMFIDSWTVSGKGEGFTIPADNPRKRIDYIWISKSSHLRPKRMEVLRTEASDHLPIVADLEFETK